MNAKYKLIILTGDLTVINITASAEALRSVIDECSHIVIDIKLPAEVDITFLQLVESARIHAKRLGKSLRLAGPVDGVVRRALERAGLAESFEQAAFWFPGPSLWLQGAEAA